MKLERGTFSEITQVVVEHQKRMKIMESITYDMERKVTERLANLRSELGTQEIENRIASTNMILKKINNDMTPVTDKGITVGHLM